MSQMRLAELARLGRPAISEIESGRRNLRPAELIRLSEILAVSSGVLLGTEPESEMVVRDAPAAATRPAGLRINVPRKNLEKFKEVLLYVLDRVGSKPNIGETVIYKILYFIDFDFYEKYEEQLIGATYIRNRFGPTPVEFAKVIRQMENHDLVRVKSKFFNYPQTKYLPLRKPDLSTLEGHEIAMIDSVLDRLGDMTAAQISRHSHGDVPWLTTGEGKPMEYERVFYRTAEYSVRDYDEHVPANQTPA
jgi:transcriptional regulator with XRE-family HTH domain